MTKMNLWGADLNLLVVFDAIARTRSVTAAADVLSLSQPAVSHALKRLRNLMRDRLFVRGRDGLVPTPRAQSVVADVRSILAAVGRVLAAEAFEPHTSTRSFRLAGSDYAMMTIIPPIVAALREHAPHVSLEVENITPELPARLETGDVDLAFYALTQPAGPLASHELFRESFVGLVCERHPLAKKVRRGRLPLKDYLAFPHVLVTLPNSMPSPIDALLADLGKARRIAMVTPNFAANIASLRGTDLIMSLPSRLAFLAHRQGLELFKLPLVVPDYPYLMTWHHRADSELANTWLRELVIEAVSSTQAPGAPGLTGR